MARIYRNPRKRMFKKNPTFEEDTSNLPCEIIENILSRLPAISLLRFKSVSKPWYSLISDAKFARYHLIQTKNSGPKTLVFSGTLILSRPRSFGFLGFKNQNFQLEALELPLKRYRQLHILCSCDGLVLMKSMYSSRYKTCGLWNPSTRTYTKFSCKYRMDSDSSYGLCYDASSDDYKFVLLISDIRYALFSYRNNSWIEKEDSSPVRIMPNSGPGLFVNGALHWLATKRLENSDSNANEGKILEQLYYKHCTECRCKHYVNCPVYKCNYNFTYEICCFDPRDDKFKKLSKPACFDIGSVFCLTDLGGQLCLYRNTYDYKMLEIWMMKEYGAFNPWTKLLTIENVPAPHRCIYVEPLCLINKTNIVLNINELGIFVYNPKEKKFCEMHVTGAGKLFCTKGFKFNLRSCWNDSLVLPSRNSRN